MPITPLSFQLVSDAIVKAASAKGIKNAAQLAKVCDLPINTSYALWSAKGGGLSWTNLDKVLNALNLSITLKKGAIK